MDLSHQQLAAALDAIAQNIGQARRDLEDNLSGPFAWSNSSGEWTLGVAYLQLLVLCEALALPAMREEIAGILKEARKAGIGETEDDEDGDLYLKWAGPAHRFRDALQGVFLTESAQSVTKDLEAIIRAATYAITDVKAFSTPPESEGDVHARLEAVLRCMFPDLLHKPKLSKAIKNFEPDTGIPSIGTLIEYKFVSQHAHVPLVADQILADTRGYASKEWRSFLYVIYETRRLRPEVQWRQLLRQCAIPEHTSVIVLTGDAANRRSGAPKAGKVRKA